MLPKKLSLDTSMTENNSISQEYSLEELKREAVLLEFSQTGLINELEKLEGCGLILMKLPPDDSIFDADHYQFKEYSNANYVRVSGEGYNKLFYTNKKEKVRVEIYNGEDENGEDKKKLALWDKKIIQSKEMTAYRETTMKDYLSDSRLRIRRVYVALSDKILKQIYAMTGYAHPQSEFKELYKINFEFDGLCELISNYVITENLLNSNPETIRKESKLITKHTTEHYRMNRLADGNIELEGVKKNQPTSPLGKISLLTLNKPAIKNSHILNVFGFFRKMLAILFGIYPNNIFSFHESPLKNKKINSVLLEKKLKTMPDNTHVKFLVFKNKGLKLEGHSMVIKKTAGVYSFFDPNHGEYKNLSFPALCEKINGAIETYKGNHMAFIDAKKFIADLKLKPSTSSINAP